MIEYIIVAGAGVLAGLAAGGFVHRARYRAWSAERELLKSQIDDESDGLSDIDLDEIVETAIRNRAMGVEPVGLVALLVERYEAGDLPLGGIDRSSNDFWNSGIAGGGDMLDGVPADNCNCQFCDGVRRLQMRQNPIMVLHQGGK
jgi:hypothetical protein